MKEFKNKFPISRLKKDLYIFGITILIIFPTLFSFYSYRSEDTPDETPSDLPEIYISCNQEINGEEYMPCIFKIEQEFTPCNIKYRGAFNIRFDKKGYRLELIELRSLLGMRKDDDWQLFACYFDHTRMRYKLAFDLWRSLNMTNPTAILPRSKYVKLFLNDDFKGLYLLAEKNDRRMFNLEDAQNNKDTSLIFQVRGHHYNFNEKGPWEQDYPNLDEGISVVDEIIDELTEFMTNSTDQEFFDDKTGIFSKFDKINLIDFYIFNMFIHHKDFWSNNYYLMRNTAPNKFFLIPWDFDGSFGQYGWKKYDTNLVINFYHRNHLFVRLFENDSFTQDVKNRWHYLRETLWTNDFIIGMLTQIKEEIINELEIDLKIWPPITIQEEVRDVWPDMYLYSNEKFDLDESIEFLFNWINERLAFCDKYLE